jgi:hypothetical protein
LLAAAMGKIEKPTGFLIDGYDIASFLFENILIHFYVTVIHGRRLKDASSSQPSLQ